MAEVRADALSAWSHTAILGQDGRLLATGPNNFGGLGLGDQYHRFMLHEISTAGGWNDITCGNNAMIGRKPDGSLWFCGENFGGQAGVPGSPSLVVNLARIGTDGDWLRAALGNGRAIALKSDGSLWTWGTGPHGMLGMSLGATLAEPTRIGTANDWRFIATCESSSLAIKTDGSLWAWGQNGAGQLGNGWIAPAYQPARIGTSNAWSTVSIGYSHAAGIQSNGSLWTWGGNSYGQLGNGSTSVSYSPIRVGGDNDWLAVATGAYFNLALKTDHSLWAWGDNTHGQLGLGNQTQRNTPVRVGTSTGWQSIAAGINHSAATMADGSLWTWGSNAEGQLGDTSPGLKSIPAEIIEQPIPEISLSLLENPVNSWDLRGANSTAQFAHTAAGMPKTQRFTLLNHGTAPLVVTGLAFPPGFSSTFTLPTTLAPGESTLLPVSLDATVEGELSGTMSIVSNDPDEGLFQIGLTGTVLSPHMDQDGDGLSDALEFQLTGLGFSWTYPNQAMLAALRDGAHHAGLVSREELQTRSPGALLECDPETGRAAATLRLQRSPQLTGFLDCGTAGARVDGTGRLLIPVPHNETSGFFRFAIEPSTASP